MRTTPRSKRPERYLRVAARILTTVPVQRTLGTKTAKLCDAAAAFGPAGFLAWAALCRAQRDNWLERTRNADAHRRLPKQQRDFWEEALQHKWAFPARDDVAAVITWKQLHEIVVDAYAAAGYEWDDTPSKNAIRHAINRLVERGAVEKLDYLRSLKGAGRARVMVLRTAGGSTRTGSDQIAIPTEVLRTRRRGAGGWCTSRPVAGPLDETGPGGKGREAVGAPRTCRPPPRTQGPAPEVESTGDKRRATRNTTPVASRTSPNIGAALEARTVATIQARISRDLSGSRALLCSASKAPGASGHPPWSRDQYLFFPRGKKRPAARTRAAPHRRVISVEGKEHPMQKPTTPEEVRRQEIRTSSLSYRVAATVAAREGPPPAKLYHSRPEAVRLAEEAGLPSMTPSPSEIPIVTVPPPPLYAEGVSREEARRLLLVAYRGAVALHWPDHGATKMLLRGTPSAKNAALLDAAAVLLIDRIIAPAAWAWFSINEWQSIRPNGGPPALSWVFGARLSKGRWRYRRTATKYESSQVRACPIRLELYCRLDLFLSRLRSHKAPTVEDAAAEFSRTCPDWYAMVDAARVNAIEANRTVRDRIARGVWVWADQLEPLPGWSL